MLTGSSGLALYLAGETDGPGGTDMPAGARNLPGHRSPEWSPRYTLAATCATCDWSYFQAITRTARTASSRYIRNNARQNALHHHRTTGHQIIVTTTETTQ